MHHRTLYFCLLFCLFTIGQKLSAQTTTMYNEEKISFGLGVGIHYSVFGLQGKYFFSDFIGAVFSTTYSPYGLLWNAGAEIRIPDERPGRIAPYGFVMIGTNSYADLDASTFGGPFGSFERIREQKAFIGATLGAGIKLDVFNNNKSYLKLGCDLRFTNNSWTDFVDNFNAINLTTHKTYYTRFLPSIGYVFCLSRKKKK